MSIIAEILVVILQFLMGLSELYLYIIFASIIISWVQADPRNQIVRIIYNLTEPALSPIRRRIWRFTSQTQLDLSPMVLWLGIIILQVVLGRLIEALSRGAY